MHKMLNGAHNISHSPIPQVTVGRKGKGRTDGGEGRVRKVVNSAPIRKVLNTPLPIRRSCAGDQSKTRRLLALSGSGLTG